MRIPIVILLLAVVAAPVAAGVVFEVETRDHSSSSPETHQTSIQAQGGRLAMTIAPSGRAAKGGKVYFDGGTKEMKVQDDDSRSYFVMNEETMEAVASMASQAQQMMEQALRSVPQEQREAMEKMMKERGMPGMPGMGGAPARPAKELRNTGERATQAGYPCVKYLVVSDGRTVRELWVTDWSNVEGGQEAAESFEGMAEFFQTMLDSIADAAGPMAQGLGDNSFEFMRELDGFPVVTREFDDDGSLESESTLRSARRETIDPAEFEPPAGYKQRQMFPGG